jgi:hypothetical protein
MTKWVLDPAEVDAFETSGRSGGRRQAAQSRALDVSGCQIRLMHRPTGIEVAGEVPEGHYSRAEMTRRKADLRARLYGELEQRVARHLRIPGRQAPHERRG